MTVDQSILQTGVVVGIVGIGITAAFLGHWDVVGLALAGLLGALHLSSKPASP